MKFTVFGKPEGKARPRMTRSGHTYTPEQTKLYEERVRLAFRQSNPGIRPIGGGPVRVDILAFYAIPKSASKKLQAAMRNNELTPVVKPDWDNVGKIVCDALNGVAWLDDAQVAEAHVEKRYGITPMVCVRIDPIEEGCGNETQL